MLLHTDLLILDLSLLNSWLASLSYSIAKNEERYPMRERVWGPTLTKQRQPYPSIERFETSESSAARSMCDQG